MSTSLLRLEPTRLNKVVKVLEVHNADGTGLSVYATRRWHSVEVAVWSPQLRETVFRGGLQGWVDDTPGWERYRCFVGDALKLAMAKQQARKEGSAGFSDEKLRAKCPVLWEFLTETVQDGKPRKTATLSIFADATGFKAFLNDREAGYSLCATSESFLGLPGALEARLTAEEPDWRPIGGQPAKRGRSK